MVQTSKKGFSPILIIIIVAVIAVAGGGYLFSKNGSVLNIASVPRVSEKDFPDIKDPILKKHFVAQANTTSYRITSNSSGRGELSISEIQLKGTNFNFSTKTQVNGKDTSDYIVMNDTTYIKDFKDNKWWKQKVTPAKDDKTTEVNIKPEDFKAEYEKKQTLTYKDLGKEACGNLTCYKYEEVDPSNTEGKRTFWFDTNNYLLRKDEFGFGEFKSTNEYAYDNISINEPSPTKDVPEGANIYQYLNQGLEGTTPSVNTNQTIPQTVITNIPSQNTETIPTEEIPPAE